MAYRVKINEMAVAAMLMNGLEAFLLPMGNKPKRGGEEMAKGHEIFGHIFGAMKKHGNGDYEYTVDFVNFDITACSTQHGIETSFEAMKLKKAIAKLTLPGSKLLGDFHTHPYRLNKENGETLTDYFRKEMWEPSTGDEQDHNANELQLDLIMAVINAQRLLNMGTRQIASNCFQFDLESIRFCLAAYVRGRKGDLNYHPYVDAEEVNLKRPKGIGIKAKQLDIDALTKEYLLNI